MATYVTNEAAAANVLDMVRKRMADPTYVWGHSWGFDVLDRITGGIQYEPVKEMVVLISRPNVGKSAIAGKIARKVAKQMLDEGEGRTIRVALMEMSVEAFQIRLASFESNVPINKVESGFITEEQFHRFNTALASIRDLPIEYMTGVGSVDDLERFVKYKGNCAWWMLDHIGMVAGANNVNNSVAALGDISTRIQQICHRYAPGLIIGHQNRDSEKLQDKRPTLSAVAGADKIGRDADKVFGLYREDIYLKIPEEERNDPKPGELIILKNRSGRLGTVYMIYDPTRTDWKEDPELNRKDGM